MGTDFTVAPACHYHGPMQRTLPTPAHRAGRPDAGLGHQLADHETRRDGLPATDLPHAVHGAGPAGAGRRAGRAEGAVPDRTPLLAELFRLAVFNMFFWHVLAIVAIQSLSSGRAAILGYTMPIFSAVIGALWFGDRLARRAWGGVAAAALGVALLLWHELTAMAGRPLGVLMMLTAAATWAVGTQMLRRTTLPVPTLTIAFWMTAMTTVVMTGLSLAAGAQRMALALAAGLGGRRLQRAGRLRIRADGVAVSGARLAAGGLHPERDVHPGAGRVQRRPVAGRGAALAGLGRRGPDGAGDCDGAAAGPSAPRRIRPEISSSLIAYKDHPMLEMALFCSNFRGNLRRQAHGMSSARATPAKAGDTVAWMTQVGIAAR